MPVVQFGTDSDSDSNLVFVDSETDLNSVVKLIWKRIRSVDLDLDLVGYCKKNCRGFFANVSCFFKSLL